MGEEHSKQRKQQTQTKARQNLVFWKRKDASIATASWAKEVTTHVEIRLDRWKGTHEARFWIF